MSILTDFDPLSMNICIFSAFDPKRSLNVEKWHKGAKMPNKMTECIFNALAFLFYVDVVVAVNSYRYWPLMLPLTYRDDTHRHIDTLGRLQNIQSYKKKKQER